MTTLLASYAGLDGVAWQRLCMQVLLHRHTEDLVPIPDKDRGDAGLEAFTVDGLAYQCYSPDEPLSVEQRYNKHRDKMTKDVGKFIENAGKLKAMLGDVRVKRWILLVPLADSREIVVHATRQTERIRASTLAYADNEIYVLVRTLHDYQANLNSVVNERLSRLSLPPIPAPPDFSSVEGELIETMHRKLSKIPKLAAEEVRRKYLNRMLDSYIKGRSHRDFIRDHYEEIDHDLDQLLGDLEERLETEHILHDDPPEKMLLRVITDAEDRVRQAVSNLSVGDARTIAFGQVADWLMRCPLDFDDSAA